MSAISIARNFLLRHGLYAKVRPQLGRIAGFLYRLRPATAPGGDFTHDYFSVSVPLFERHLGHLKRRPCRLLEIGALEGRSALWMAQHIATHPSASIQTIDAYENPRLRRNLMGPDGSRVTFHPGFSVDVLPTLPREAYDFVYIDGCHWCINVLEDAVLAFRLLKVGGIMAFDDYLLDDPAWTQDGRPKEAIDAFLTVYAGKIDVLERNSQVWIRKREGFRI
jgi:cephalosporin hydroxylase